MIKQPNGLYIKYNGDTRGEYGNYKINIDKEKYINNKLEEYKKELEYTFDSANMKEFNAFYQCLINTEGLEKAKQKLESMGFEFEQVKINTILLVKSDGFSQHDCCSYGKCPICGVGVDSWKSECPNCKQKIKFE